MAGCERGPLLAAEIEALRLYTLEECWRMGGLDGTPALGPVGMAAGPVGIAGAEGVVADTGDGVCIGLVCAIGAVILGATSGVRR